jgi:hypothetical protein
MSNPYQDVVAITPADWPHQHSPLLGPGNKKGHATSGNQWGTGSLTDVWPTNVGLHKTLNIMTYVLERAWSCPVRSGWGPLAKLMAGVTCGASS